MKRSYLIIIVAISISLLLVGIYTFLSSKQIPSIVPGKSVQKEFRIEDVPGVTNVKRISDSNRNRSQISDSNRSQIAGNYSRAVTVRPAITPKPLPYPRIMINYSTETVSSIRNEVVNDERNNTFVILTLDIRNFGYKFFDAHPSKFRIIGSQNVEFEPLVNITTRALLNTVIVNNSRAKGDLVFIFKKNRASINKIIYLPGDYTILYHKGIPSEQKSTSSGTPSGVDCMVIDC